MHIDAFHAETGVLELHGKLQGICYLEDRPERGKGFFAKLLR